MPTREELENEGILIHFFKELIISTLSTLLNYVNYNFY